MCKDSLELLCVCRVENSLLEVCATQHTPYRDRDRLMTRVKDRVITIPPAQAGGGETASTPSSAAAGDTVSEERNADIELLGIIQVLSKIAISCLFSYITKMFLIWSSVGGSVCIPACAPSG